MDASNIAVELEPDIYLSGGEVGYLSVGYQFDTNLASGDDWDYVGNRFRAKLKFKPNDYFMDAGAAVKFRTFPNSSDSRKDREYNIGLSLGMEKKFYNISGGVTFITNDSNLEEYSYRRLIASVNVGASI